MKLPRILFVAALAAVALTAVFRAQTRPSVSDNREEAYRANNVGVAMLEQFNYTAAADAFRRALRLEPSLALAHLNLAIALLYVPDLDAAEKEAAEAARLLPRDPHPPYVSGLIERARGGREQQAREAFERVLQMDAKDVGTLINLGQLDLQQQRYSEAAERFRTAVAEEPYSVTATYNLGLALTRAGRREEGQKVMEQSQRLRTGGYGIVFSANYLEQGRYAEAVSSTGAEPDLVDPAVPDVTFARTPLEAPSGGARIEAITPIDFDGDGDMDLVVVTRKGLRLLRNDRGTFTDVTRSSTLGENSTDSVAAVTGDYDNDGKQDLLVLRSTATVLFHNDGNGRFSDATTRAGLPRYQGEARTAAFVDVDHDGDLDIVVGGNGPLQLIRNNGNGTFTDITAQTGVTGAAGAIAIAPTDFDNHRDIDLLVARSEGPPALFKNLRDGTFRDVAADAGLRIDGSTTAVAAADVNKDSFPDFFFGGESAPGTFALSDGRGRFVTKPGPAASAGATAARFFDYDNDGLLDLLTWSADGPHLVRQVSDGWTDVTTRALGGLSPSRSGLQAQALALADVDGDGDMDVIVANGDRIDWWRNDGGSRHPSVRVRLAGRASNHDGIGAKVDVRAGSLRQRLESSSASPAVAPADLVFGLGRRGRADVVRVLWPSGILQAETSITAPMLVSELDRKPSSCPFLFAWNGRAFGFVTDFLGGGEMGYWEGPGVRNTPDPDEYVRIRGDQLQPKDGRYELRVTNELEEGVFLDRVQLLGVSHPRDVEIFPNEGMTDPPKPFRVFAVSNLRPPLQAVDEHGHDVTSRIAERDRRYVDDFVLERFRGYAATHTLALKLPEPVARGLSRAPVLLLTGWTDYAFSSDNVAAHQAGLALQPPRLEIKTADGSWRTLVADIGIPVGRPQTIVVDLTAVAQAFPPPLAGGELRRGSPKRQRREGGRPAESIELRVVTNMRIYWDQILIGDRDESRVRIDRMDPIEAHLRSRGFSAEVHPDGREPASYDYDRVTRESPWKLLPGRYTREGDVLPLLTRVDDRFVVSQPGDEVVLSFDARLAPLPDGWTRTFLLYADGFSKEMDINSSSPDLLAPLPFHGMVAYPYASPQRRGDEFREYLDRYNTRIVARPIPSMDKPDKP